MGIGAARYCLEMTFGSWRFTGKIQGKGRGAFALAESYLCGSPDAYLFVRPQDEIIVNQLVNITTPKRVNEFRMKLHNQLMR
ncbi:MAG: hypothetical protein AB1599_05710, partial [Planctomycetota bacterium]